MMDAMFIGSMHGVADSCSLNGGFRLDVANTRRRTKMRFLKQSAVSVARATVRSIVTAKNELTHYCPPARQTGRHPGFGKIGVIVGGYAFRCHEDREIGFRAYRGPPFRRLFSPTSQGARILRSRPVGLRSSLHRAPGDRSRL